MNVFGLELLDLPEGVTALECAICIKALNEDGEVNLYERKTDSLNTWEAVGMLMTMADSMRAHLVRAGDPDA